TRIRTAPTGTSLRSDTSRLIQRHRSRFNRANAARSSRGPTMNNAIHTLSAATEVAPAACGLKLQPGAHLVTPRFGYEHHGIYVGNGKVVHYAGLSRALLLRGPIEEVSLEAFADGRAVAIKSRPLPRFAPDEIVARARSRLGENCYRVTTNNCEHFCE